MRKPLATDVAGGFLLVGGRAWLHRQSQFFDLARHIEDVINTDKGRFNDHIPLTAMHDIPAKSDCTRAIMFLQGFDGIDTSGSKGLHPLSKQMGDDENPPVRNGIGCL